jgi:ABC-2 type transport system permease protein
MEILSVLKFEIQKGYKSLLLFSLIVGGFILLMLSIFDPTLFVSYNDILAGMPPEMQNLVGGLVDLSTFEGFFNLYIFEFAWMWYGIYIIIKVSQDLPSEIEGKTIDLILSKPIRRVEYIIGKQLYHILLIITAILSSIIFTIASIFLNPNINSETIEISGFVYSFIWLGILLIAIESTVLLISTILPGRKSMAVGFAVIMGLWFISAYSNSIPIENIDLISLFTYYSPKEIIIEGETANVLNNITVLIVWYIVTTLVALIYFDKKDIKI